MPEPWISEIAGFPILAYGIFVPALREIADASVKFHPYMSKEAKESYMREIHSSLVDLFTKANEFFERNAEQGGAPILVLPQFEFSINPFKERRLSESDGRCKEFCQKGNGRWVIEGTSPKPTVEELMRDWSPT